VSSKGELKTKVKMLFLIKREAEEAGVVMIE
jgi:hypothetical protein